MYKYFTLLRIDHWIKNIFIIPGVVFSFILGGTFPDDSTKTIFCSILSLFFAASANYTINEWLDRESDKRHPEKKNRSSVIFDLNPTLVYLQYMILVITSIFLANLVSIEITFCNIFLIFMGIIYNVKPLRSKDIPIIDVLTESVNNPIRFLIGWYILNNSIYPPSAILISYWFGGAFLMNTKRLTELKKISKTTKPSDYRKSFKFYNEKILISISVFYSLISSSLLIVFIAKYKLELILISPFISLLFAFYIYESLKENSFIDSPEKLYKNKKIVFLIFTITFLFFFLFNIEIKILTDLFNYKGKW